MWLTIVDLLSSTQAWVALFMLTLMEIILGIDNIIFISIIANKLPESEQAKARNIGMMLAMVLRIVLLFGITWIVAMQDALFHIDFLGIKGEITGQSLILFGGGLFLLYKSVSEIHHKLEGPNEENEEGKVKKALSSVIIQITLINVVFSFDSILTAVGLTQDLARTNLDPLPVMIAGVVLSMIMMMLFVGPIGRFVNKHPSVQVLGLSFLILIAFMLILEGAHIAHLEIAGNKMKAIPKAYLYFAIAFALFVEFLNIRIKKKGKPVQLHGALEEAKERDLYDMDPEQ
ncbi:MAG: TerC family protein [Saprospiraceae bacterium]|nr:TerC family protein [Saprospiraceae bacterium]